MHCIMTASLPRKSTKNRHELRTIFSCKRPTFGAQRDPLDSTLQLGSSAGPVSTNLTHACLNSSPRKPDLETP